MKTAQKIFRVSAICIASFLPVAAVAHYFIFPQETRSIFVKFSDFKHVNNLYFSPETSGQRLDTLELFVARARTRVSAFWGMTAGDPKIIFCDREADYIKYADNPSNPAVTYFKLGPVIVLSADGLNEDIIAHEMSHAEFYRRIGFYAAHFKIPAWFDEGLAMQNDYRDYYSEDSLRAASDNFRNLPDVKSFTTNDQFLAGTHTQVMLNYMTAKHIVGIWYSKEKMEEFIREIKTGKSFTEAFGN